MTTSDIFVESSIIKGEKIGNFMDNKEAGDS
jgi:hypothetical protein